MSEELRGHFSNGSSAVEVIECPGASDIENRMQREVVIKRFEKPLASYAEACGMPRHCFSMTHTEKVLLSIIEKGFHNSQPDHVLVAIAIVISRVSVVHLALVLTSLGPVTMTEETREVLKRAKEKAVKKTANWLCRDWGKPWLSFFTSKSKKGLFSFAEWRGLLCELSERYFPLSQLT